MDGVFKIKGQQDRQFFDLNDLLKLSRYSGAKGEMDLVVQASERFSRSMKMEGTSQIDFSLLQDEATKNFAGQFNAFMKTKMKEVHMDTAKKIIKKFVKNVEMIDNKCQTEFNDDQLMKEMKQKLITQSEELDELKGKFNSTL